MEKLLNQLTMLKRLGRNAFEATIGSFKKTDMRQGQT